MNSPAIEAFLKNTYSIEINIITIRNILNEIRKIFYRYYIIEYQSNLLGERDANNNFSIDESLFTHNLKGEQIWVIGCVNNSTKDFRVEAVCNRNSETLKGFITSYIDRGNKIITDGWQGYSFLSHLNGYEWEVHNHGAGDFGFGLSSTSHVEALWHQLKSKLKKLYNSIPSINFLLFLREAEWHIKTNGLNDDQKINEFFDCYKCCENTKDVKFESNLFLNDSDFSKANMNDI